MVIHRAKMAHVIFPGSEKCSEACGSLENNGGIRNWERKVAMIPGSEGNANDRWLKKGLLPRNRNCREKEEQHF
jgi:hypothetical protein